jgi:hypothetical protein
MIKIIHTTFHSICLLGVWLALTWTSVAEQPFTPERWDPVLEPWRWQSFPELKGAGLRCLAQDEDGHMWFGVNEGVRHYDGLNWLEYTPDDGLLGAPINTLCTTSTGDVYAGSDEGISVFRGERWSRVFPPAGNLPFPVDDIIESSGGELWAATGWGALHLGTESVTLHTSRQLAQAFRVLFPQVAVAVVPDEAVPQHKWTDGTGVRVVKGGYLGITRSETPTPIWAVASGGPGENLGLKPGDIVDQMGDRVANLPHLTLDGFKGSPVKLVIKRGGRLSPSKSQ